MDSGWRKVYWADKKMRRLGGGDGWLLQLPRAHRQRLHEDELLCGAAGARRGGVAVRLQAEAAAFYQTVLLSRDQIEQACILLSAGGTY